MRNKHIADERNYTIIFDKIFFLYFKKLSKFQTILYRNISMDTLRTGHGSHGFREAQFGNRCAKQLSACRVN